MTYRLASDAERETEGGISREREGYSNICGGTERKREIEREREVGGISRW